jgi:hypothetical protein
MVLSSLVLERYVRLAQGSQWTVARLASLCWSYVDALSRPAESMATG